MQRMRELSIQAQNGSNGSGDRANLDTEFQQPSAEITRIAQQTVQRHGHRRPGAGAQTFQVGANNGDTMTITTSTVATVTGNILIAGAVRPRWLAIDAQLDAIITSRATYGAAMSRFEFAISNLQITGENQSVCARPHHGCGLRGRDRQPVALADPAAGRHGDGGAG